MQGAPGGDGVQQEAVEWTTGGVNTDGLGERMDEEEREGDGSGEEGDGRVCAGKQRTPPRTTDQVTPPSYKHPQTSLLRRRGALHSGVAPCRISAKTKKNGKESLTQKMARKSPYRLAIGNLHQTTSRLSCFRTPMKQEIANGGENLMQRCQLRVHAHQRPVGKVSEKQTSFSPRANFDSVSGKSAIAPCMQHYNSIPPDITRPARFTAALCPSFGSEHRAPGSSARKQKPCVFQGHSFAVYAHGATRSFQILPYSQREPRLAATQSDS